MPAVNTGNHPETFGISPVFTAPPIRLCPSFGTRAPIRKFAGMLLFPPITFASKTAIIFD
jgi:hypothetical protein